MINLQKQTYVHTWMLKCADWIWHKWVNVEFVYVVLISYVCWITGDLNQPFFMRILINVVVSQGHLWQKSQKLNNSIDSGVSHNGSFGDESIFGQATE